MSSQRYLVQQPKALQNLALDKVAVHVCSFVDGNSIKLFLDLFDHHPVHAENLLNRRIDIMRNKLKSTLPWMYYDELADVVMRRLLLLLKDRNFNYHSHKYIIGRTMEILYTDRLTSLVFSNDPFGVYFQFLLYSRADYLTGLTHLRLISTSIESEVIRLLPKLNSLKSLDLTNVCTDNILYCIAENCKLIESLKIEGHNSACSLGITDNSVKMLTKLQNLQNIELYNTSVTKFGVAMLLLSCKNLERINMLSIDLIEPLEYIAWSSGCIEIPCFKLKFYRIVKVITPEQLQFVFKMCPQIEDLTIKGNYIYNLSALADLKYLKALYLGNCGFYEDQIEALLEVTGRTLLKLHLFRITQLDCNAVKWIYEMCPKMESLTLNFCSMLFREVLQKNNVTQHKCLEKISFKMNSYEGSHIEDPVVFMLSNCPNIKHIDLQLPERAINYVLLEVINRSPRNLTKLETLMIAGNLEEELLNRIVSNCINPIEIIKTRDC